jgi:hypothetical protein
MLKITIPARPAEPDMELYDDEKKEFFMVPGRPATKEYTLQLEHSLVSLAKWESKWCKPFLSTKKLTEEETIDYIRCMTLTQNIPADAYANITDDNVREVSDYIDSPMTATTFSDNGKGKGSREIITAELIYYWMIALNIPPEYQKWHLNRLLTLIRVCNIKNTPPKKMSKRALMSRNASLNAARRQQLNTNG